MIFNNSFKVGFFWISISLITLFLIIYQVNLKVSLLFMITIIATFLFLKRMETFSDYLNPYYLFVIFSLIAFQLKFLINYLKPSMMNFTIYPVNFLYNESDFILSFLYFILGYFAFILGFGKARIKFRSKTLILKEINKSRRKIPPLSKLLAINIAFSIINCILMFKFQIGLLLGKTPIVGFKIVGILFYFFLFGSQLLLLLYIYSSIKKSNYIHIIISLSLLFFGALISVLNYSKSGFFTALFALFVVILSLKDYLKKIPRVLKISALFSFILFITLFPLIQEYRFISLRKGTERELSSLFHFAEVAMNSNIDYEKAFWAIVRRVGGFDSFLPIIAYGRTNNLLSITDFIRYFNKRESSDYALFYRTNIMGVKSETGFEISIWSFFYIYFGIFGIIFGMFLWGKLNKFLFRLVKNIIFINDFYGVPLLFIYLMWFLGTTFGFGPDTPNMAIKTFVAAIFIFLFWTRIFGFKLKLQLGSNKDYL